MRAGEGPSEGGPPLKCTVASWAPAQARPSPKLPARWTFVDRSLIVCPPVLSKGKSRTRPVQSNIIGCDEADGLDIALGIMLIYEDVQAVCQTAATFTCRSMIVSRLFASMLAFRIFWL